MPSKLGLGTVQFGLDYGAANSGCPGPDEVERTLVRARELRVSLIDTAPGYGDAEAMLGAHGIGAGLRIVTKTPTAERGSSARAARACVEAGFRASCARLRVEAIYGLLEHRPAELLGPQGEAIAKALLALREEGRVERIGASVYTQEELETLTSRFPLDLVQVPVSLLDQRLLRSGALARVRERGIEVHARSALLQGVIALAPEHFPQRLAALREPVLRLQQMAARRGLSAVELAIGFVASRPEVDVVVCGAVSPEQLGQLASAAAIEVTGDDLGTLAVDDAALVDPSRWS